MAVLLERATLRFSFRRPAKCARALQLGEAEDSSALHPNK